MFIWSELKVAPYSFLKSGKFVIWIKKFSGLLLVRKQELCDLYKTIFLELEMINTNDVTVVAMATMSGFSNMVSICPIFWL